MKFLVKQLYNRVSFFQKIQYSDQLYIFIEDYSFFFETNNFDRKIIRNIFMFFYLFIHILSIYSYIVVNSIIKYQDDL